MDSGATIVTFGEAMFRLTVPGHARLEDVDQLQVDVAGAELNVAVAMASLGIASSWISAVPDSPVGRRIELAATASGVMIGSVVRVPETRLGVFFVENGVAPRPLSVWYDRLDSAFARTDSFDFEPLAGARFAVISGITAGLGPASAGALRGFVDAARSNGVELCLDVNYRERLWPVDAARDSIGRLMAEAGVVVCSARDAERVFGCVGSPEEALRELSRRWCPTARVVVLTVGSDGALGRAGEIVEHQTAFRADVVDRFGAGDAFMAGLLWGLLSGDLVHALRAGAALAALKCSVRGDQARFSAAELVAVMAGGSSRITR